MLFVNFILFPNKLPEVPLPYILFAKISPIFNISFSSFDAHCCWRESYFCVMEPFRPICSMYIYIYIYTYIHTYYSTIAPHSFIHLPPTLYNVFLPVLQFSPVSIIPPLLHTQSIHLPPTLCNVFLLVLQFSPVSTIPPMLHTHSFNYHPRYIMFLSQYFSFPLSVSFHQYSILIHSLTTHAI